jgi:hypothetical protein
MWWSTATRTPQVIAITDRTRGHPPSLLPLDFPATRNGDPGWTLRRRWGGDAAPPSPYDPVDAQYSAAKLLCAESAASRFRPPNEVCP